MTQISGNLERQTKEGMNLLSITVMVLFFFVIWESAGVGLNLSPGGGSDLKELRYQESVDKAAGKSSMIDILKWAVFGIAGLFLHFVNKERALYTWSRAWPLAALLALIVLSVLWSSVPDIALRRVVKQLLLIAIVAGVVMGATSPRQIVHIAVVSTGLIMSLDIAAVGLLPRVGMPAGDFEGLHGHKNAAGAFAMITIFVWFTAARWSSGAWTRAALFGGTLIWFLFLLGTNSRTAIISTAAALLFIVPLRYCIRQPVAGIIFGFCMAFASLCAIYALIAFNISFADIITFVEGDRTTLSGRAMKVWQIAYNVFLQHQLLGTGYGSLWSTGGMAPVEQYTDILPSSFLLGLNQSHSGYFDILATLGLVGIVTLFVFLAGVVWIYIRSLVSADRWEDGALLTELAGLMLLTSLLANVTEAFFLRGGLIWVFLVFCYLMLCSLGSPADREAQPDSDEASAAPPRGKPLGRVARMDL